MSCKNAERTDYGWECAVTERPCRYPIPYKNLCSEEYEKIKHTERWLKEHETN